MAPPKKSVPRTSSDLASRMEGARRGGGGIVPGANVPKTVPIANPFAAIDSLIRKIAGPPAPKRK